MNPYQWPAVCSVCGGEGSGREPSWEPSRHIDPEVCRWYLEERKRKLDEREREQIGDEHG